MGSDFFGRLNEEMIRGFLADESVRLQIAVVGGLLALSWLATKITKKRFCKVFFYDVFYQDNLATQFQKWAR